MPSDADPRRPRSQTPSVPTQWTDPRAFLAGRIPGASIMLGLGRGAVDAARATPLLGPTLAFTQGEMARVEAIIWRRVRHRLDSAGDPGHGTLVVSAVDPVPDTMVRDDDLADILTRLLTRSVEQSSAQAGARLFGAILAELHPDEARILAALSDGTEFAVVHVVARVRALGATGPTVLENASTVGQAAVVALPDCVPWYVSHLQRLGLVRIGPESVPLEDTYDMLLTEPVVREARESSPGSKVIRRSLRMSPLGDALWQACQDQPPA